MGETLSTVQELIDESGPIDVTHIYEEWRDSLAGLMEQVKSRFELTLDPSTNGLEVAGEIGSGIHGQVQCFSGPDIDWMVYSWMADPKNGFANLHLTISPGAHVDVPGFGLAFANFGARPWGFVDCIPRRDIVTNRDYYFKYYEHLNQGWMDIRRNNPKLDWFTSPMAYIRAATSPIAFCYSGPMEQETTDIIIKTGQERMNDWLAFWDDPTPVPADEQEAMKDHTVAIRRTVSELDPANHIAIRLFGQGIADQLVEALWGAHRTLPHAFGKKA